MPESTVQALTTTGAQIRVGDIPLRVVDVRDVVPERKRIQLCDGNTLTLGRRQPIRVVRTVPAIARPRTVRRAEGQRPRSGGVR